MRRGALARACQGDPVLRARRRFRSRPARARNRRRDVSDPRGLRLRPRPCRRHRADRRGRSGDMAPADRYRTISPHIAAVTFDIDADGPVPVERNAMQLLSAGLADRLAMPASPEARPFSRTVPISSYAGLSAALVPWLMSGGPLEFHHPFAPDILSRQIEALRHSGRARRGRVAAGRRPALLGARGLRAVISICRSPERFAAAAAWPLPELAAGRCRGLRRTRLCSRRLRPADGRSRRRGRLRIRVRPTATARSRQTYVTAAGTLGIRGALAAWPDTDTGYACTMAPDQQRDRGDGGARRHRQCRRLSFRAARSAARDPHDRRRQLIAALPHSLTGHRLAGDATDPAAMRQTLARIRARPAGHRRLSRPQRLAVLSNSRDAR